MRFGLIFLIFLSCIACARLQNTSEQEPKTTAALKPPPVADHETPTVKPAVECSDGSASISLNDCLISMANKRLPPSQPVDRGPIKPSIETIELPAIR
jgi:hypothetical protein